MAWSLLACFVILVGIVNWLPAKLLTSLQSWYLPAMQNIAVMTGILQLDCQIISEWSLLIMFHLSEFFWLLQSAVTLPSLDHTSFSVLYDQSCQGTLIMEEWLLTEDLYNSTNILYLLSSLVMSSSLGLISLDLLWNSTLIRPRIIGNKRRHNSVYIHLVMW